MKIEKLILPIIVFAFLVSGLKAKAQVNDVTTPLHLLQPDYPTPYKAPEIDSVKFVLDKVYKFLEEATPSAIVNTKNNSVIKDFKNLDGNIAFAPASFRLTSYEWGVTYAGMLLAAEATGEEYFEEYTDSRIKLIAEVAKQHRGKAFKSHRYILFYIPEPWTMQEPYVQQ